MAKKMDNVKQEIDALFKEIEESNIYKNYLSSKKQLEDNKEINTVIKEIKRLQKIVVNNKDKVIDEELSVLFDKLNSYPLYQSYLIYKDELNDELLQISNTFNNYFKEILKID